MTFTPASSVGGGGGGGGVVQQGARDATADTWYVAIFDTNGNTIESDSLGTVSFGPAKNGLLSIAIPYAWDGAGAYERVHQSGNRLLVNANGTVALDAATLAALETVSLDAATLAALETITALQGTSPWVVGDGGGTLSVDDGGGILTVDSAQLPAALVGGRLDVNVGASANVGVTQVTTPWKAREDTAAMTWASVKSAAPAANAVQATTGALAAGDYDFDIALLASDTVAVGKGLVVEHRNAADAATLQNLGGCEAPDCLQLRIRRYTLAANERIRVIAGTAAGAAASMYVSAIGRRIS